MAEKPSVTITLVLYNTADFLRDCLKSIRKVVDSGFAELIVVNNASPDNSADIVREEFPAATVIHSSVNRGFAGGCNLAWPQVRGKYWLLLNPDTIVPEGAIPDLVSWMEKHPEIGMGSPRLTQADGNPIYLSLGFPSIWRSLLELSRLHKLLPFQLRSRLMQVPEWGGNEQVYVDWVPGTALLIRCETVNAVGLLSERYFMYGEDVEWCWRAKQAGWKVAVYRKSAISHIGGGSTIRSSGVEERYRRFIRNCYDVDTQIVGRTRAWIIMGLRAIGWIIEALHPFRSQDARAMAFVALRQCCFVWMGSLQEKK